jgi:hypothetical protein
MTNEAKEILDRIKARETAELLREAAHMLSDYCRTELAVVRGNYDNSDVDDTAIALEALADEFDQQAVKSPDVGTI